MIGMLRQKSLFLYSSLCQNTKNKEKALKPSTERREEKVTFKEIEIKFLARKQDCCLHISMTFLYYKF